MAEARGACGTHVWELLMEVDRGVFAALDLEGNVLAANTVAREFMGLQTCRTEHRASSLSLERSSQKSCHNCALHGGDAEAPLLSYEHPLRYYFRFDPEAFAALELALTCRQVEYCTTLRTARAEVPGSTAPLPRSSSNSSSSSAPDEPCTMPSAASSWPQLPANATLQLFETAAPFSTVQPEQLRSPSSSACSCSMAACVACCPTPSKACTTAAPASPYGQRSTPFGVGRSWRGSLDSKRDILASMAAANDDARCSGCGCMADDDEDALLLERLGAGMGRGPRAAGARDARSISCIRGCCQSPSAATTPRTTAAGAAAGDTSSSSALPAPVPPPVRVRPSTTRDRLHRLLSSIDGYDSSTGSACTPVSRSSSLRQLGNSATAGLGTHAAVLQACPTFRCASACPSSAGSCCGGQAPPPELPLPPTKRTMSISLSPDCTRADTAALDGASGCSREAATPAHRTPLRGSSCGYQSQAQAQARPRRPSAVLLAPSPLKQPLLTSGRQQCCLHVGDSAATPADEGLAGALRPLHVATAGHGHREAPAPAATVWHQVKIVIKWPAQPATGTATTTTTTSDDGQAEAGGAGHAASPASGPLLLLTAHDVTQLVEPQERLEALLEQEHKLLEGMFPRHVLAAMASRASVPSRQAPPLQLATAHRHVTVLFADIVGFTSMCNSVDPMTVMAFLNGLYTRFDELCDIYGVYKVETIGDCYMVVGGLVAVDEEGYHAVRDEGAEDALHALKVMSFAKAMLREVAGMAMPHNGQRVQLRVGLHSGPVMAGIVGAKMPRFCLFGDTVNTASRMESTCQPGAVHASAATQALLPGEAWQARGPVQVKGKGEMMTFLWRPAPDPLVAASPGAAGQNIRSIFNLSLTLPKGFLLPSHSRSVNLPDRGAALLEQAYGARGALPLTLDALPACIGCDDRWGGGLAGGNAATGLAPPPSPPPPPMLGHCGPPCSSSRSSGGAR